MRATPPGLHCSPLILQLPMLGCCRDGHTSVSFAVVGYSQRCCSSALRHIQGAGPASTHRASCLLLLCLLLGSSRWVTGSNAVWELVGGVVLIVLLSGQCLSVVLYMDRAVYGHSKQV